VAPRATLLTLAPQTIDIPLGEAREVAWNVKAPAQLALSRFESILWEIEAKDTLGDARDALKASQRILPAVPLTVQQATLVQLDGAFSLPVVPPTDALADGGTLRGGLKMALQPKLAEGLPGVRDWLTAYPFTCLEQKTSKAIGLRDIKLWRQVAAQIPSYLDGDGLAGYFPPRDGEANQGSDTLTAYLLAASHEASGVDAAFGLSDEARAPLERGLTAFVEGRLQRKVWSPRADLDVRKLAAIEALWETEQPASFSLITIGDLTGKQEVWSIRIPYLTSFLACNNFDCEIRGVNDLQAEYETLYGPNDYIPLMVVTYWSFRIMFALELIMLFASAFALLVVLRNWSPGLVKWLKWMPYTIPLPFIAGITGWITTEMGRQPWIVQGLLTTAQAISPNLTIAEVAISLTGFTLIYSVLTFIMIQLMYKFARQGTEAALKKSVDVEEPVSAGDIILVGAQD